MRQVSTGLALVPKTPEIPSSGESQQEKEKGKGKGLTLVLSDLTLGLQGFRNTVW